MMKGPNTLNMDIESFCGRQESIERRKHASEISKFDQNFALNKSLKKQLETN